MYTQVKQNSVVLDEETEAFYTNISIVAIATAVFTLGAVIFSI
jgi:hypothetical protein